MDDLESYGIKEGTEVVKGFLDKIVSPVCEELGLMLADKVRSFRFKNQIKILESAQKYVDEHNITIKTIPTKLLVPLLESASLEEDESLREKWCNLLVNYVDSSKNLSSSVYPYILSQLSSDEVNFLWDTRHHGRANLRAANCIVPEDKDFSYMEFDVVGFEGKVNWGIIYNLKRLGLINEVQDLNKKGEIQGNGQVKYISVLKGNNVYKLTPLGQHFVEACCVDE